MLSDDLSKPILEDFLKTSWHCIETMLNEVSVFKEEMRQDVKLFQFKNGKRNDITFPGSQFFLRASVEYSNPQLTVEEVQGIVAARLLEVCTNYFNQKGLHAADDKDIAELASLLKKPPEGFVHAFLLNTDDIEPDRYSMNPLKKSIVSSGQSALPSAAVKTGALRIDEEFFRKYNGSLICSEEVERINRHLQACNDNYLDLVDSTKYEHLERLSTMFGIDLCLPSIRLPLSALKQEGTEGLLHHIVRETHDGYEAIECVYRCMGRSMKNLTTLLTIPHSKKGYGSKRAARGRIYFEGSKLKNVKVSYRTTKLYPNAIDPQDISVAEAEDSFIVEGEKLTNYSYADTPSSPQFFLYSLASPENAVLWHGVGAFGASELLKSYTTTRVACAKDLIVRDLGPKYGLAQRIPLQFNLVPKYVWFHPVHRNIDASIGCIENLQELAKIGMKMEHLSTDQFTRK